MGDSSTGDKKIEISWKNGFKVQNYSAGDFAKFGAIGLGIGFIGWSIFTKDGRGFVKKTYNWIKDEKEKIIDRPWKGYKRTPVKGRPEDAPAPKEGRLLDVYIRAGRVVFLFAPTDVGKTTLAVQLASEMAFREESKIFPNSVIRHPKKVIYYDEEYEGESFQKEGYRELFESNDGRFLYTQGAHDGIDDMLDAIYYDANQKEYEGHDIVMFIDNIKAVCKGTYSGKGTNGEGRFINSLKSIKNYLEDKKGIRLTVVVIAHTTKEAADEKRYKTITEKNLQGTNDQSDFANELIALGDTLIGPEYKRVKALKNKKLPKDGKVWVVKRIDETTFEYVAYELESDTIDKKIAATLLAKYTSGNMGNAQPDSASTEGEDSDDEPKSWSREKIELTDELLACCREVYDEAINSGKGKTAALKEAAGKVLGDEGKYKAALEPIDKGYSDTVNGVKHPYAVDKARQADMQYIR